MEPNGYLPSNSPVFFVEDSDDENDEIGNGSKLFNNQNSLDISSFCEAYCTDPKFNLGLQQEEAQGSIVAASPPNHSGSLNETISKINLPGLLHSNNSSLSPSNCSQMLSTTESTSIKRPIKQSSRRRGRPQKFIKLEGVTSKLNGKVFQVY